MCLCIYLVWNYNATIDLKTGPLTVDTLEIWNKVEGTQHSPPNWLKPASRYTFLKFLFGYLFLRQLLNCIVIIILIWVIYILIIQNMINIGDYCPPGGFQKDLKLVSALRNSLPKRPERG